MKIRPVILCGGAGTRLWPNQKNHQAKQFIDFGGWTLIKKTLERINNPILDYIMPKFDDPKNWIPLILFIWIYSAVKDKENRLKLIVLVPIVILLCDQIGGLIKDFQLCIILIL